MASTVVPAAGEESKVPLNQHHHVRHQAASPRTPRRSWPLNSSSCGNSTAAAPKCVCAPATHAGSFKCRLHRVNSHGRSAPVAPLPQEPPISASSTWTVEAL